MHSTQSWFSQYLDIIFFIYGLAFVVMGIAILAQPRRESAFKLAGILGLLAAFGLTHGLNEWLDMWAFIRGTNAVYNLVRWFVVTSSFLFLFEFGRRLFNINSEARGGGATFRLGWWVAPVIVAAIGVVSLLSVDFWKVGSNLARYFLCFTGSVLTGYGFFGYFRLQPDTVPLRKVKPNFIGAAIAFIAYGILGGLVVSKADFFPASWLNTQTFASSFYVPVQLFRAVFAVAAAVSISGMLRLFNWESVEKLEEALAREHESCISFEYLSNQYQLILDSVGDGIFVLGNDGTVTLLNSAGARMTGYGRTELSGKDPHTMFHHTRPDGTPYPRTQCPIYMVLADGNPRLVTDEVFWRRDGTSFPVEYVCTPIRRGKGSTENREGAVVVFSDVTWRRQAEEKQKKLQAQLIHSQKMDAIGTLAAGVAHDFNNLLTVIQGHADVARMKMEKGGVVQKNLDAIYDASVRAANLTRQLLMFGRRQPMDMAIFDVNTTIENMLKMLIRLIGETIKVETELKTGLWNVRADEGNIEQVIMNLVVNARDAMPDGGTITIKTDNVVLDEEACRDMPGATPGKYVCMWVSDTGYGMSEETRKRIFEPFFTTKAVGKGTGLGLAVVYGIVKEHGGLVYADSRLGEGTVFRVYLPAALAVAWDKSDGDAVIEVCRGKGELILLVEDNPDVREFDASTLRENGYQVLAASCVAEALKIFRQEDGRFDLLLTDVGLPDRNGLQLVDEVRALKPDIPVVLCSGYTDNKSQWPLIRERGLPFLQKPFPIDSLLRTVRQTLNS